MATLYAIAAISRNLPTCDNSLTTTAPEDAHDAITLEAIINMIDHGMDVRAAIDAPRLHHQ